MSAVDRQFLPWDRAPLDGAVEWLHREYGPGTPRDSNLSKVVVVLPGARAGRILLEGLANRMPRNWQPPEYVTTGKLTDRFIRAMRSAPRLVRTLAWERALRNLEAGDVRALLSRRPTDDDNRAWHALAEEVREVFGKLSAECLDFHQVSATAMDTRSQGEQRRWKALAQAQEAAEAFLESLGMCDPHRGRVAAMERGELIDPGHEVLLLGVLEANGLVRRLVSALEHVRALVFAPSDVRDMFDDIGCLRPAQWLDRPWAVPLDRWRIAMGPDDQARKALEAIADMKGVHSAEQITIGIGDSEVVPFLERRLHDEGVCSRDAKGIEHAATPPARLLGGVLAFLRRPRFSALADLVRHPDVEDYLMGKLDLGDSTCAQVLDEYHADHLPGSIPSPWLTVPKGRGRQHNQLARELGEAVNDWLAPLNGKPRHLSEWSGPLCAMLEEIYGERSFDSSSPEHHLTCKGLLGLARSLAELGELPPKLGGERTAGEALELVLSEAAEEQIQLCEPEPGKATVELLGWLELAFDDAPALVVTGFNETLIPKSLTSDRYLPDSLRKELGLPDDEGRLGRDLFTLEWLMSSRDVVLLSGRHTLDGEPLRPSRLAFRGSDAEILAGIRRFLEKDSKAAAQPSFALAERRLALPSDLSEPPAWSASAIGAYLRSPYLFALQHLTGLKTLDDRDKEMNPRVFGILGHTVLKDFASSDVADSTDPEAIADWLEQELDAKCAIRFGSGPLPAVQLQRRQLAWRLRLFARVQAARTAAGWRIVQTEWKPTRRVTLPVGGEEVPLTGVIDRIDQHESGRWAILDYKFSEKASAPEKAHQRAGKWQSVQLPLYVHLARELVGAGFPELGYFNLSATESDCGIALARKWDESILEDALEVACRVILDVRTELARPCPEFARGKPVSYDIVTANVCGDTLLSVPGGEGHE
jgi:RecB family exonuclease